MGCKKKYKELYIRLLKRLPRKYPHLPLVIHNSIKHFERSFWDGLDKNDFNNDLLPEAYFDSRDFSVHVCLDILNKQSKKEILFDYLHEMGHAIALLKYGYQDPKWYDKRVSERYANQFAYRWVSKLKRERF